MVQDRYTRFRAVDGFSEAQSELDSSKVAVVGLGATGSTIAENLARRGIKLVIIDRDHLEFKDVNTSSIYDPEDVQDATPKAKAAERKLSRFTEVECHVTELDPDNVDLLDDADIVMDGTDNLDTRFMISEYCQREGKPWVYTAAVARKGYSAFFHDNCFNCIFEEVGAGELETCETAGVMREISSQAALKSSLKAVRYLSGKDVEEKLETVEGESFSISSPGCRVCEDGKYPHLDEKRKTSPVCGENRFRAGQDGDMARLKQAGEVIAENEYLVRANYEGREVVTYSSGRTVIEARDRNHASSIFTEIMGV